MNDRELAQALETIHREAAAAPPSPTLREQLLAIPEAGERPSARRPSSLASRMPAVPLALPVPSVPLAAAAAVVLAVAAAALMLWLVRSPTDEALLAGSTAEATTPPIETPGPSDRTSRSMNDDLLPGVTLDVEAIEPGVFRVISDGLRELSVPLPTWSYAAHAMALSVDDDGTVRIHPAPATYKGRPQEVHEGHEGSFRLGEPVDAPPSCKFSDCEADDAGGEAGLGRLSDGTYVTIVDGVNSAAAPEGGWRGPTPDFAMEGEFILGRSSDGVEWEVWTIVPEESRPMSGYEWLSEDGSVWLGGEGHLARFDGDTWTHVDGPPGSLRPMDVGPDGTAWAVFECRGCGLLYRLDGDSWTEFDTADGVPPIGGYELPVVLEVAPDGSVWVNSVPAFDDADYTVPGDTCGGVHHFDGETWSRYLDSVCIYDLALAPDGTAWVRGGSRPLGPEWSTETDEPVEIYAIREGD